MVFLDMLCAGSSPNVLFLKLYNHLLRFWRLVVCFRYFLSVLSSLLVCQGCLNLRLRYHTARNNGTALHDMADGVTDIARKMNMEMALGMCRPAGHPICHLGHA